MNGIFSSRAEAGRILAPKLREFAYRKDVIVLGLPRGGAVVGYEVARKLRVAWDLLVVRKLGVPGQPELAMGAIAGGGVEFRDVVAIAALNIPLAEVDAVARREQAELERRELAYRGNRPPPNLRRKVVILVDDGIATGATMRAAVHAVSTRHPQAIVVAAPVASTEAVDTLRREVTAVVSVITAPRLFAVGEYYRDFRPVEDAEVRGLFMQDSPGNGRTRPAMA